MSSADPGVVEVGAWSEEVAAVLQRIRAGCRDADGRDPLDEAADLALRHHGLDTARLWLAGADGFALLRGDGLDLAVAPSARGEGLGAGLSAAAVAAGAGEAWSHGDHPAAAALAARHGFTRDRELWVMRRAVADALHDLPARRDPERGGHVVREFRAGDEAEVLRVNAAAFADHPEQGAMDAANLAERMAEPWFSPAGLLVAVEDGRMLGFHWTKQHSAQTGEVYVVGIDPAAQGRGLGKELTLAGLAHLASVLEGEDAEVILYVESDNHPARAVYEGLGFTHADADTHVQYRRDGVD